MQILHLTHTDINSDSRILKEMISLSKSNKNFNVSGIGVTQREGATDTESQNSLDIYAVSLWSRKMTRVPRIIRHSFSLVELTVKMLYRAVKLKPKVVHCHDTLVLPLGAIVKLFTGAKLIYDAHELESNRNALGKTLGKMTFFVEKHLWKYINALIVVSPSIEKWYHENIGQKYSQIILNAPVLEENIKNTNKAYLRECFSIADDSKVFLYVGALVKGRGIDLMVEAFKGTGLKSSLVFLGYGHLSDKLKKSAAENSNIYVHDAVAHDRVVSIAQSADVGLCLIQNVSLSDYYCLPNKLFEYCFSEIPVLASDFPDIKDTVKKYNLGKCCSLTSESISIAIKEFEDATELPKVNSKDLRALSWEAQEEKLIKLYDKLISGNKEQ